MATVRYEFNSAMTGLLRYMSNGDLYVETPTKTGTIDAATMREIANEYRGANRIHKPIALLFWIDCKNGNFKNWK